jgi:hypothetical protein
MANSQIYPIGQWYGYLQNRPTYLQNARIYEWFGTAFCIGRLTVSDFLILPNQHPRVAHFQDIGPVYMPTAAPPTSLASLPEELLQYFSPYRVVVCTSCRYAVTGKQHPSKLSSREICCGTSQARHQESVPR